ncbi:MAG: hypothetical protein R3B09_25030 [Nannocystaceae bacterium]
MDAAQRSRRRRAVRRAERLETERAREVRLASGFRLGDRWGLTRPRLALAVLGVLAVVGALATGSFSAVLTALRGLL